MLKSMSATPVMELGSYKILGDDGSVNHCPLDNFQKNDLKLQY